MDLARGTDGQPRTDDASGAEPSLAELLSRTTQDLSGLLRAEVELAKVELKEEATTAARAGAMFGAAGVLGHLALLLALFAAAWGLDAIMPTGLAFLVVAVVVGVVAAVMFAIGRDRLREATPVAPQTAQTLKEDV